MKFKMKTRFDFTLILAILLCRGCKACFKENSVSNRSITTYSPFYEECCCTEPGYTFKDLQWLDPSNGVIGPGIDSNVFVESQDECLSLYIRSANQMLSGSYRCVTNYKGVSHSQTHNLDVYDRLNFFNTSKTQYLVHGQDSRINCQAKGASQPFIRWYKGKDGQNEIYNDTVKYQFVSEGIIVRSVVDEDAGTYKCTASVPVTGEEIESDIEVQVMTKPKITHLTASPEDTVVAGNFLTIECIAEGLPTPVYTWQKVSNSKFGSEKRNATWIQDNNKIRFESIEAEDAGIYYCYAENFSGNTSEFVEIKVLVPPEIIDFNNRTAIEGTEIPMHCDAIGYPKPNVTITYEGKDFNEEKTTIYEQFITNYSLLKVTRDREGIYICNASNEVDFVTEYMYLTVQHPPFFAYNKEVLWGWNGEKVELSCEHEANPPSNLTWRYFRSEMAKADEKYINDNLNIPDASNSLQKITFNISEEFAPFGLYECKAKNSLGEAVKLIDLRKGFVPLAVQNISITEVTIKTVTFSIDFPPYYDGPPILGYKAEYDLIENYNVTNIHQNRTWAKDRPFKLEKLRPNSTYSVRFAAINKVGTGPWSEMVEFDTLEKSVPDPPMWEVDSLQFSSSNVLKWKESEDNGEPVDYYALRYCPVFEQFDEFLCKEKLIEAATEYQIDDLHYNTTYYFELIAHNSLGNSSTTNISLSMPVVDELAEALPLLSNAAIIGVSVIIVIIALIFLDLILLFWRHQGIIAICCYKKSKKKPETLHSRDKKGLLKDNGENKDDTLRKPNNGHKEYEYNKTTGIITGKHSSV